MLFSGKESGDNYSAITRCQIVANRDSFRVCPALLHMYCLSTFFNLVYRAESKRGEGCSAVPSVERGEKAAAEIRALTGGEVVLEQMDLGEN